MTLITLAGVAETKGKRTRQALLSSAIRRFAQDGYKRVTLSDIAREVGISPAAVYAYFPGKEALFTAAVDADAAGLIDLAMSEVLRGGFVKDWSQLIRLLIDAMPDHPLARRVLAGLEPESTARLFSIPALTQLRQTLGQLLADEQRAGAIRSDIDPLLIADGLESIVLSLLIANLQTGGQTDPDRTRGVVAVLEATLHVPVARRRRSAPPTAASST